MCVMVDQDRDSAARATEKLAAAQRDLQRVREERLRAEGERETAERARDEIHRYGVCVCVGGGGGGYVFVLK